MGQLDTSKKPSAPQTAVQQPQPQIPAAKPDATPAPVITDYASL